MTNSNGNIDQRLTNVESQITDIGFEPLVCTSWEPETLYSVNLRIEVGTVKGERSMKEESLETLQGIRSMLMQLQNENKSHKVRSLVTKFLADIDRLENRIINGKTQKKIPALYDPVLNRRHDPVLERFLDEALADFAKENAEIDRIIAEMKDPEIDRILAEISEENQFLGAIDLNLSKDSEIYFSLPADR